MSSGKRQVVLFITEGSSDDAALTLPLRALFAEEGLSDQIECAVFGTDPLIHEYRDGGNPALADEYKVIERIKDCIKDFLAIQAGKIGEEDIACVAVLSDLDACYCNDDSVVFRRDKDIEYDLESRVIRCKNKPYITERNAKKRDALGILISDQFIQVGGRRKAVPLGVFYMNINLECALYHDNNPHTEEEKQQLARVFRAKYKHDAAGFRELLSTVNLEAASYENSLSDPYLHRHAFDRMSNLLNVTNWIKKSVHLESPPAQE